jgi:hypothetical protein
VLLEGTDYTFLNIRFRHFVTILARRSQMEGQAPVRETPRLGRPGSRRATGGSSRSSSKPEGCQNQDHSSRCGSVVLMDETAEAIAALYVTDG